MSEVEPDRERIDEQQEVSHGKEPEAEFCPPFMSGKGLLSISCFDLKVDANCEIQEPEDGKGQSERVAIYGVHQTVPFDGELWCAANADEVRDI